MPFVDLAVGIWEPDRPEEYGALPGDDGVHHHHHEFSREITRDRRCQQECFAVFLKQDHRKRHPIFFARMDADKTLRVGFLHRHFSEKLFDTGTLDEFLIKPQLFEIERVRRRRRDRVDNGIGFGFGDGLQVRLRH